MKIAEPTVEALQRVITGDPLPEGGTGIAPYRSGPQLVHFFNQFGANDEYGQGFPSRWYYTQEAIRRFNGTNDLKEIIEAAVDPRHFLATDADVGEAVEYYMKIRHAMMAIYPPFISEFIGE